MSKKKQTGLTALPLGGLGEIGLNMMCYECDQELVLVDVGLTFSDEGAPGADLVLPDIRYVRERAKRLRAIVITHAHEDHIGALPYFWDELPEVPVYLSAYSRKVLEHKLTDLGYTEADFRDRLVTVNAGETVQLSENFSAEFISLTHSILEMFSIFLRTPHGNILHTGDFKLDRNPSMGEQSDIERLKAIGKEGVRAVFTDSTNIFKSGRVGSEGDLLDSLNNVFSGIKGKLVFGTFSSNAGRLIKVIELAAKHGRKTAILSRSAQNNFKFAKACGYVSDDIMKEVIDAEQAANMAHSDVMLIVAGTQGEPNSALGGLAAGQSVRGHKLGEGDTVLFSSRFIPGNERAIYNMINRLTERGATILQDKNEDLHVSGHAAREELAELYKLVKPEIAVPVHGEFAHLTEHAKFAREQGVETVFRITNGTKLSLGPDTAGVVENEKPPFGRNFVDGMSILDSDKWVLKDRRRISFEGVAFATLITNSKSEILAANVTSRGLIDPDIQVEIHAMAEAAAEDAVQKFVKRGRLTDENNAKEAMRQAVRRVFSSERGKKPLTITQIISV
jgi:ribonuclease J